MNTLFLKAPQLTAEIMRAHYCEHDLDKILPLFHETLTWIGAGEDQICYDYETIKDFFLRTYAEKAVPTALSPMRTTALFRGMSIHASSPDAAGSPPSLKQAMSSAPINA